MDNKDQDLILNLLRCEIIKLGNFKLKSGAFSPIYVDLRRIIHYPSVVKDLAIAVRAKENEQRISMDAICGVPYTALPVASVFSVIYNVPMIMKRKEAKDYGTKKLIEGVFSAGDSCLIIEDIMSSGSSIIETANALRNEGLNVQDCIVVVNRQQGGLENCKKSGITVHSLFDIKEIVSVYCSVNKVENKFQQEIGQYFKDNSYIPIPQPEVTTVLSFKERGNNCNHPVAKRLFSIMDEKQTNLCVAVDTDSSVELLQIAEKVGPHICLLKTHIDIVSDYSEEFVAKLSELASKYNFLIFEDRKFADIGNTVKQQYQDGIYKIKKWADIVTVHGIPGSGIIDALKTCENTENRACVLIAEMSSKGTLTNSEYKESVFKMAESHTDFVIGYVAQYRNNKLKNLIHMCPGVNIASSGDCLGQQYRSPEEAVANGADIIIVGRGICKAHDVLAAVTEYKNRGFNAYSKCLC